MIKYFASLLIVFVVLFIALGCGEKLTKEEMYSLAEKHEAEENFSTAIKTYEKYIKKFPDAEKASSAKYKIALIYSNNLGDFDKSVETHHELIEKYPESKYSAQSLFMIGFINANNLNDLKTARQYYEDFLQKYPDNELASSVKWELEHLGKDINELDFLNQQATGEEQTN